MSIFKQIFKGFNKQMGDFEREEMELDARDLLAQGEKLQAIKFVRRKTGMDLKEAAHYVDSLEQDSEPEELQSEALPGDALKFEARELLAQGKKIQAVKLVREQTGWGLKQSKDFVDSLM